MFCLKQYCESCNISIEEYSREQFWVVEKTFCGMAICYCDTSREANFLAIGNASMLVGKATTKPINHACTNL